MVLGIVSDIAFSFSSSFCILSDILFLVLSHPYLVRFLCPDSRLLKTAVVFALFIVLEVMSATYDVTSI